MKNAFLAILTICLMSIIVVSCNSTKNTVADEYGYSVNVNNVVSYKSDTLSLKQLDSVLVVDKLPAINRWQATTYKDDETYKAQTYYMLFDKSTCMIYTVKQFERKYILFKKRVYLEQR